MTIWERYFLFHFFRIFFLFLFCFYGLYVLIDYASHTNTLFHHHISWKNVVQYYLFIFASKAEILIPLALLIAFVHTVCTLNNHRELVAFMASGLGLKTLLKPFLLTGLFFVFLLYANEEYLLPIALKKLRRIEEATKHQKRHPSSTLNVQHLILEDGSLLIFQHYDALKKRFFDAYWIQSVDSVYRIKSLSPNIPVPLGYFVDHLKRQTNGELLQEEAYLEWSFPTMKFNPDFLQSTLIDPDIFSISELANQILETSSYLNEKESKTLTAFYWKLAMPWLCLLALIAPAPFTVRFSRQFPVFLVYVGSLFGLIAFYMFMDAAQVIAKRQVLTPFWSIISPFLLMFGYFGWRFNKIEISSS